MKKFIVIILGIIVLSFIFFRTNKTISTVNPQRFWQVTAVDTVKYSRDSAGDKTVLTKIPQLVREAAKLNVTHIAIDTPYDEEFYPVLRAWVYEARRDNLKVWFRGNFSAWEGWFGYPKMTDFSQHNILTKAFIIRHPELFQDGDIFTPAPEPENGGPGDPRGSDQKTADFNAFLVSSYNNCVDSFAQIHKNILCGFFSTNGDIAKQSITPETVAQIGNIIVIDHYVDSTQSMQNEIDALTQKFPTAKIVLGEFGAPIPDINGQMTEEQQASFLQQILQTLYTNKTKILGVNYWTLAGGSTSLLNDNFSEKKAFQTVADYYLPSELQGRITDTVGNTLPFIQITDKAGKPIAQTAQDGTFSIDAEKNTIIPLYINAVGHKPFQESIIVTENQQKLQDIQLQPENLDLFYQIRLFFVHTFNL